mgnify:CR=1 FL=1
MFHNPKTSMANSDIMSKWIKIMLPCTSEKILLILDSFRGHLSKDIKHTCDENNIIRAVIPGGWTSKCQPLDLSVNRSLVSFKEILSTPRLERKKAFGKDYKSKSSSWLG